MFVFRQISFDLSPHSRIRLSLADDSWRNEAPFDPFATETRHKLRCFLEPSKDLSHFESKFAWAEGPFGYGYMIKKDDEGYCDLFASFPEERQTELKSCLSAAAAGKVSVSVEPLFHSQSVSVDGQTAFALIDELHVCVTSEFGEIQ